MKGLLNFLSSPAGQRFGAGMRGLSAGLLQAGAPRVGAPGPNAWGAGLSGFSQGIEAEREKERLAAMYKLKKQLAEQQLAEQKRKEAEALRREQIMNEAFGMGAGAAPQSAAQRASMGAAAPGPTVGAAQRQSAMTPQQRLGWELAPAQMAANIGKPQKWTTPQRMADDASSTGYSMVQVSPSGETRKVGEAPPPREMFDPKAEEKKARFGRASKEYDRLTEVVEGADKTMTDVTQMLDLVNRVDSGTFATTKLELQKIGNAFGLNFDVADAEAMRAKGMDFVMQRISQTKGAISEKEMAAFKEASAGLQNTPAGNRMILELASKIAQRERYAANKAREAYSNNPLITKAEMDNIRIAARGEWGGVLPSRRAADVATPMPGGLAPAVNVDALVNRYLRR